MLGICYQLLVGKIRHKGIPSAVFGGFARLARSLITIVHRPARKWTGEKGRFEMSSKSQFTRNLVAICAALVMSTVAVTAAVTPVQANAYSAKVSVNA
jgi:hypothetical protein